MHALKIDVEYLPVIMTFSASKKMIASIKLAHEHVIIISIDNIAWRGQTRADITSDEDVETTNVRPAHHGIVGHGIACCVAKNQHSIRHTNSSNHGAACAVPPTPTRRHSNFDLYYTGFRRNV